MHMFYVARQTLVFSVNTGASATQSRRIQSAIPSDLLFEYRTPQYLGLIQPQIYLSREDQGYNTMITVFDLISGQSA